MPVDFDENAVITWVGWRTTLAELKAAGWILDANYKKIVLRHYQKCVVATLRKKTSGHGFNPVSYAVEAMVSRKQFRAAPPRLLVERNLTVEDIPALYDAILHLQKDYPKPPAAPLPKVISMDASPIHRLL